MNLRPPGYEPDELPTALSRDMVPETGVEPARDYSHGILSPGRLPIPPLRQRVATIDIGQRKKKDNASSVKTGVAGTNVTRVRHSMAYYSPLRCSTMS